MKKLIVDRKTWFRGSMEGSALLRSADQTMCCLGFYGIQLAGKTPEEIMDVVRPDYATSGSEWGGLIDITPTTQPPLKNIALCSDACRYLMVTNDSDNMGDTEREARLTEKFKEIGVEVEFIN